MGRGSFEVSGYEINHQVDQPTAGMVRLWIRSPANEAAEYNTILVRFMRGYDGFTGYVSASAGVYRGQFICGFDDWARIYDCLRREKPLHMGFEYEGDQMAIDPGDPGDTRIVRFWSLGSSTEPIGEGDADRDSILEAIEGEMGSNPP